MQTNNNKFRPDIKGVKILKSIFKDDKYFVIATRIDKRPRCCGRKTNIKDYKQVNIKSPNYRGKKVILEVKKQRYICPVCKKTYSSELDFVDKKCTISKEIKNKVESDLHDIKSLKQIAKENNISHSTVLRILDSKVIDDKGLQKPEGIFIDEFKGNADNEKYT